MKSQLYTYQIPSSVTFFEGSVERNIAFVYGLSTVSDTGLAYLIKMPAGTYNDYKFTPAINFIDKYGNSVNVFEKYYPERNAYQELCDLYVLMNSNTNLGYNETLKKWTSDPKAWTYGFSEQTVSTFEPERTPTNITKKFTAPIKSLLNNGVIFTSGGISSFCYNQLNDYQKQDSQKMLAKYITINLAKDHDGEKVFNAYVNNDIGYIFILDCKDIMAKITTLPACRYYNAFIGSVSNDAPVSASLLNITACSGTDCSLVCTDPFNLVYPQRNAAQNGKYILYSITNNTGNYYNNVDKCFVTNQNQATWYFNKNAANIDLINATNISKDGTPQICSSYVVAIKNLITYGIEFPCSSFICDNINDYIQLI